MNNKVFLRILDIKSKDLSFLFIVLFSLSKDKAIVAPT